MLFLLFLLMFNDDIYSLNTTNFVEKQTPDKADLLIGERQRKATLVFWAFDLWPKVSVQSWISSSCSLNSGLQNFY
ncbi:hypothetical protein CUU66_09580 [Peribacillus deserti]|uniref:Uncharacterized protein n=1 Tax=Peribacillus deserti TaxID=673318 RepID=A0A2N5M6W4_9BACI|nr:hypothetical protein CUU66_09580 [Peribacillus deserti]